MLRHLVPAALFALALATGPARAADTVPPIPFKERTLPNGLQVISAIDRTTPNVTVQVWYGVGSKDDPKGRSGFAHLFEHLMFKATKDLPPESIDRFTEDVGGMNNASTDDDYTEYHEVVPAGHLERLLWVEAERMGSLVVDDANFKSERDVVKEELRQRVLADPYGRFFSLDLPEATYTTGPYKQPTIGSIADLDAATLDDVQTFHQAYYRPDDATLIVVGNFDQAALDGWVDKYFGKLKPPPAPIARVAAVEPPRKGPGVYDGYGPNVPLPAVAITWLAPAASDPDAPALTVLDAILSAGKSSRLYDSLVYEKQLAVQVFSNASLPQKPGMFMVGAIMSGGHTIAQGEQALLAEVRRLREAPPSEAEMTVARNQLITSKVRERETIEGRAAALGYAVRVEGDAARANTDIADLQAVTAADVQRVAAKYLPDDRRMVIRYQPESARPKGAAPAKGVSPTPVASQKYDGPVFALAPVGQREAPPPIGAPVVPVTPKPAERTLANGLRVIVARSSDLPLVTAELVVKAGAWADPPGLAGTAGMAADMLTEGTKTRSAREIAAQIEALGATISSEAGLESSSVDVNVMPDKLPAAMTIMADVARNPAFAPAELERQRQQALDGLKVAYQQPGSLAGFAASPVLYGGTPLGHVATGTPASLAKMTPADLARLHGAYFRPDNAVLVLSGDIDAEQGFALAQQAFGDWARPPGAAPAEPPIAARSNPRAVAIDLPGTGQAAVTLVAPGVARSSPNYYAALVSIDVLGGGYSARLNQEVRVKRGLSYGAGASLSARRSTGAFLARAQTKNESAPVVLDLMRTEMKRLAAEPADAEELKARKSSLEGSYGRELATSEGLAGQLANLALYDVPLTELAAYTDKVEAIDAAQVQAFAAKVLDPARASVIVVGDGKAFTTALKAQATNLEVIPAAEVDFDSPTLRKPAPSPPRSTGPDRLPGRSGPGPRR